LFADGLTSLLNHYNINTIKAAQNGEEVLIILKDVKPHVLLLDLEMPILNGSDTLDIIKQVFPDLKVIIVSSYHDEELIKDLLNRGACAFISKKESQETLAEAIFAVHFYGKYENNLLSLIKNPAVKDGHYYKLIFTKRELEIMHLVCAGKKVNKIASELCISEKTTEGHLTQIYKKAKVATKSEFLKYALESGFQFLNNPQLLAPLKSKRNPLQSN
jgi:DNA-binding NarL/FixJ family response regulator